MNDDLYRGYPPLAQGIEAGKEVITLIVNRSFRTDIKHSLAVCDTVSGAILGVYPGAPGVLTAQAVSAELKKQADETFKTLQEELIGLVKEQDTDVAKATEAGSQDLGILGIQDWLPYIKMLLELLQRWFSRPAVPA